MEVGKAFTLRASAPGYTSVQWFKDGVEIPGATSTPYTKENVTLEDAGKYKAVFQTPNGEVSTNEATVTVEDIVVPPVEVESIKFKAPEMTFYVGDKDDLNPAYEILPANADNKSVTWKSSKKDVVSITTKGVATALKAGVSVITVTTSNGKSDNLTITVEELPVEIESILVDPSTKTLKIGEKFTPVVTVLPVEAADKTVNWDNSDDSVASRNLITNEITAKKVGVTTFTLSDMFGKITTTLVVTVKPDETATIDIEGSGTTQYLKKGDTKKLKVTTTPENAEWTVGDDHDKTVVKATKE